MLEPLIKTDKQRHPTEYLINFNNGKINYLAGEFIKLFHRLVKNK